MAQMSRPFPGTTIGDAGPYSVINWWDVWGAIGKGGVDFGRSADYGKGVFGAIGNGLYPSENITNINVDTGAGLIDGLYCENTASVTVPIPASGAGTNRIDVIVVRKNYQQAVTYTPTGGAPTVPPRTTRITVIRGTEAVGPVAPSLTQDVTRTTYWDIPIASVQVSDAGALSNFTDLRQWAGNAFDVRVIADNNDTVASAIVLRNTVDNGSGDTDLGVGILYQLENDAGAIENVGKLSIRYSDASTNDRTRIELKLKASGWENTCMVIDGGLGGGGSENARGIGAVDLQPTRVATNHVASGQSSTLGGGAGNEASGDYATIPGGKYNEASGNYSLATGYDALADKHGQWAHSGGSFTEAITGLAQTSKLVARRNIASHTDTTWYEIYLDGTSPNLITIPVDTLWTFNVLISGISQGASDYFSYSIQGAIINDGGTTTTLASVTTTIAETDVNYDAQASFDDATDSLVIQVRRNGGSDKALRWIATIWLTEVTFTA